MSASGFGLRASVRCLCLCALLIAGCRPPTPETLFRDAAATARVAFRHNTGATGKFYYVEETGAGCAFLDYDNDGFLDLFFVQSGTIPRVAGKDNPDDHCALYRNNGDGTFTDVTAGSGLDKTLSYGQGVAIGDYDNDGFDDLYITGYGGNFLFHNENGTGKFADVTARAGVSDAEQGPRYAISAAFGDYDNDGRLDLYVCHYAPWTPETNVPCKNAKNQPEYCTPDVLDPDTHRLYHNNGDGTFTDVTEKSGIGKLKGHGQGVVWLDYNGDGREDIFVSNDLNPQFLWRNNGDGTFTNVSEQVGAAYDADAGHIAGMGIGVADYDNDGKTDLFVTNFSNQPNTLYRNRGDGFFEDKSMTANLALPHMKFLAFGCDFLDYDADGNRDLVVANGHVVLSIADTAEGVTYKQRKQLFHNQGDGHFTEVTENLGELNTPTVSRGLATGDYDNDGRLDFAVSNQNDAAQLFHNEDKSANHWIRFQTVGTKSNRDGYHAKITVTAGGRRYYSEVWSASSFASHSDSRPYFGLGAATVAEKVEIRWPSGVRDTFTNLTADKTYILTEGQAAAKPLSISAKIR